MEKNMIRSELCAIAKMSPSTFNSHRRNGNLPFDMTEREAKDGVGRTWSRFDIYDATLLIAAHDLAASQGVTWSEAARMLRQPNISVGIAHLVEDQGSPIFVAKVDYVNAHSGEAPFLMSQSFEVYQGHLLEILKAAQSTVTGYNERTRHERDMIEVLSVTSVNISHCYRVAIANAAALNIDLFSDGELDDGAEE